MNQPRSFAPVSSITFSNLVGEAELQVRSAVSAAADGMKRFAALSTNEVLLQNNIADLKHLDNRVGCALTRLKVFKKNANCVCCKREGNVFFVEHHENDFQGTHLNFYSIDSNKLWLMTVDHILPASLGGRFSLSNLQTMCYDCNQKKSNVMSVEEIHLVLNNMDNFAKPWVNRTLLRSLLDLQLQINSSARSQRTRLIKLVNKYSVQVKHGTSPTMNEKIATMIEHDIQKIIQPKVVVKPEKECWIQKTTKRALRFFQSFICRTKRLVNSFLC